MISLHLHRLEKPQLLWQELSLRQTLPETDASALSVLHIEIILHCPRTDPETHEIILFQDKTNKSKACFYLTGIAFLILFSVPFFFTPVLFFLSIFLMMFFYIFNFLLVLLKPHELIKCQRGTNYAVRALLVVQFPSSQTASSSQEQETQLLASMQAAIVLLIWRAQQWRFYSKTYSQWQFTMSLPSAIEAKLVTGILTKDGV